MKKRLIRIQYASRICKAIAFLEVKGFRVIDNNYFALSDDGLLAGSIQHILPVIAAATGNIRLFEDIASQMQDQISYGYGLIRNYQFFPSALVSAVIIKQPQMLEVVIRCIQSLPRPNWTRGHDSNRYCFEIDLTQALALALRRERNECAILLIKFAVAHDIIVERQSLFELRVQKQNAELLPMIAYHLRGRKWSKLGQETRYYEKLSRQHIKYLFEHSSVELVRRVIKEGIIDVNNTTTGNTTALFLALSYDRLDIAEELLKAGIDPDDLPSDDDIRYHTALQHAVASDQIDATVLLLNYGANLKGMTYGNLPPITHSKAISRSPERNLIAQLLTGVGEHGKEFLNRPEIRKAYEPMLHSQRESGLGWTFGNLGVRWHKGKPWDG